MRDKQEAVKQFMEDGGFTKTEATIAYFLDETLELFEELEDEEIKAGIRIVKNHWQTPHHILTGLLQQRVFKRHHPYAYTSYLEREGNKAKEALNEENGPASEETDPQ